MLRNGVIRLYAVAKVKGGPLRPQVIGVVTFNDVAGGTKVCARIAGLPPIKQ